MIVLEYYQVNVKILSSFVQRFASHVLYKSPIWPLSMTKVIAAPLTTEKKNKKKNAS